MSGVVKSVLDQVKTREDAEKVVGWLLYNFSSETAFKRLLGEASNLKQAPSTVVQRRVRNLFSSLSTRKS